MLQDMIGAETCGFKELIDKRPGEKNPPYNKKMLFLSQEVFDPQLTRCGRVNWEGPRPVCQHPLCPRHCCQPRVPAVLSAPGTCGLTKPGGYPAACVPALTGHNWEFEHGPD